VYSVVQHPEHAYLYYGITNTDDGVNGILKVNIDVDNSEFLELSGQGTVSAAVIDSTGEFAYFASDQQNNVPGKINKVRLLDNSGLLDTPEIEASISLDSSYDMSGAATIDPGNQFAYFATSELDVASQTAFSRILRVNVADDFGLDFPTDLPENAGVIKTLLMAPDGSVLYALTEFSLLKFDITEEGVSHDATLMLNNPALQADPADAPETAVISPDGRTIYVGHSTGKVTVVTISTAPSTYTVTYDGNAPNLSSPAPDAQTKIHDTALTLSPLTPIRAGYTFSSWNTAANGTETPYPAGASYTANESTTLYAQWTAVYYDILYEAGEATSGSTPNAQSKIHDGTIAIADNTGNLAKPGHSFVNWTDGNTNYDTGAAYITNASLTLSPFFIANDYTLTFEGNGSDDDITPMTTTYNSLITLPEPTRTGYGFNRWNGNETLDGVGYAGGGTYNVTESTTLYAEWNTSDYVIFFDTDGGTDMSYVIYAFLDTIATPTEPTKNGHTFSAWNVAIPATMPANDITLIATWTINSYTVTFNSNEGTALDTVTANYQTVLDLPPPTRTGHAFAGWHAAADLSGEALDPEYVLLGDITLHAAWDIDSYTLSFQTNGGSDTTDVTANYQSEFALPVAPTKTGYTFHAWHLSESLDGPTYNASAAYTLTEDTVFYAEWSTNNYRLSFDSNGGNDVSQLPTRDYQAVLGELATTSRMGHIFAGWTYQNVAVTAETPMPASDMTLIAAWTAKNYANVSISTDLDPGEEVTTNATVVTTTFTIPVSAKLSTTAFSGSGEIYNYGTLEADTLTLAGAFLNEGSLTTKHVLSVMSGGRFTASANSHISVHHTPSGQLSSLSHTRLQGGGAGTFVAGGVLTVVLDDEILALPKYSFQVLEATQIEGAFDTINLPTLPSGYIWDTGSLYSDGVLHILGTFTGMDGRPLNYPNPFKWYSGTYIGYTLNGANDTELRVYTIRGQEIFKKTFLANVEQGGLAGYNKVQINSSLSGEAWPAGVYPYLILQNGDVIGRGRMVVIP